MGKPWPCDELIENNSHYEKKINIQPDLNTKAP